MSPVYKANNTADIIIIRMRRVVSNGKWTTCWTRMSSIAAGLTDETSELKSLPIENVQKRTVKIVKSSNTLTESLFHWYTQWQIKAIVQFRREICCLIKEKILVGTCKTIIFSLVSFGKQRTLILILKGEVPTMFFNQGQRSNTLVDLWKSLREAPKAVIYLWVEQAFYLYQVHLYIYSYIYVSACVCAELHEYWPCTHAF